MGEVSFGGEFVACLGLHDAEVAPVAGELFGVGCGDEEDGVLFAEGVGDLAHLEVDLGEGAVRVGVFGGEALPVAKVVGCFGELAFTGEEQSVEALHGGVFGVGGGERVE